MFSHPVDVTWIGARVVALEALRRQIALPECAALRTASETPPTCDGQYIQPLHTQFYVNTKKDGVLKYDLVRLASWFITA
jgi:hypothetical protein